MGKQFRARLLSTLLTPLDKIKKYKRAESATSSGLGYSFNNSFSDKISIKKIGRYKHLFFCKKDPK